MTDTQMVSITPRMQEVIRHMLTNPRARYCCVGISRDAGVPSGTLPFVMQTMERAGWVTSEYEPRQRYSPRRWYRFTAGSAPMLRRAIAD